MIPTKQHDMSDSGLASSPINPAWIVSGAPVASSRVLSRSADGDTVTALWACEPGMFRWHYSFNEMIHILKGEVTLLDEGSNTAIHLGPGDTATFHAGTTVLWLVAERVLKLAVISQPLSTPLRRLRDAWRFVKSGGRPVVSEL